MGRPSIRAVRRFGAGCRREAVSAVLRERPGGPGADSPFHRANPGLVGHPGRTVTGGSPSPGQRRRPLSPRSLDPRRGRFYPAGCSWSCCSGAAMTLILERPGLLRLRALRAQAAGAMAAENAGAPWRQELKVPNSSCTRIRAQHGAGHAGAVPEESLPNEIVYHRRSWRRIRATRRAKRFPDEIGTLTAAGPTRSCPDS